MYIKYVILVGQPMLKVTHVVHSVELHFMYAHKYLKEINMIKKLIYGV